jgi:WD40 repeat protein
VWNSDQRRALSCSDDKTVRLWEVESGRCLRVLEGHTGEVRSVAWGPDGKRALSGAEDKTVRLWEVESGRCLRELKGRNETPNDAITFVAWSADQRYAFAGNWSNIVQIWNLSEFVTETRAPEAPEPALPTVPDQVQYTNAKVLLVGESGAGKTGLSMPTGIE